MFINFQRLIVFNDKFALSVLSLNQIELATEEDKQWEIDKWATIFKAKTWEELQMAATTTTLEKVADSIFVQNTDEQIRYAMFKKQEAEAHEKRLKSELAQQQSIIDEQKTQLDMQKSQLDERDRTIELLQAEIKALKGEN